MSERIIENLKDSKQIKYVIKIQTKKVLADNIMNKIMFLLQNKLRTKKV